MYSTPTNCQGCGRLIDAIGGYCSILCEKNWFIDLPDGPKEAPEKPDHGQTNPPNQL